MAGTLELELTFGARRPWVPRRAQVAGWAGTALAGFSRGASHVLSVRVVGAARSRSLNLGYRHKNSATNVLSFAGPGVTPDGWIHLGELVICAPVVAREAAEQGKSLESHWAHMTVHGVLHLLGFDHEVRGEARKMEMRELQILDSLGFSDPYA